MTNYHWEKGRFKRSNWEEILAAWTRKRRLGCSTSNKEEIEEGWWSGGSRAGKKSKNKEKEKKRVYTGRRILLSLVNCSSIWAFSILGFCSRLLTTITSTLHHLLSKILLSGNSISYPILWSEILKSYVRLPSGVINICIFILVSGSH